MRIASPKFSRERTPFIGRQGERKHLLTELQDGTGLVSIIGPSGIGKTRLARQVAGELVDSFEEKGGVWFCDLSGCTSATDLELAVARTLEIHLQQGEELARSIANRGPLLLILDNADAVATSSAAVLDLWLERCVELQVVMTSLVSAGVSGEAVFELQPLDASDAVALYLDRAHRAWADRRISEDEARWVRELVQRLDRLPLAIEFAAARVRILPPRALLTMFEKRFELLRIPSPKAEAMPQRKGSLLSALELTWSHLEPYEQLALARAAVFEGGFSTDAAGAIIGEDDHGEVGPEGQRPRDVAQTLDDLQRKALIIQDESTPSRFNLLESVRSYALQELRQMGKWEETIRRHATYFLSRDETQAEWEEGPERISSLDWLKRERANLLAILHRFLADDPALATKAGISLIPLSRWEGHPDPDTAFPKTLLDAATRSSIPILLARTRSFLATLQFRYGQVDQATRSFEEAARLAREAGDNVIEAKIFVELALLHTATGDLEQAQQALAQATSLVEEPESPSLIAQLRLAQGFAAFQRGALEEAEGRYIAAVELLQVNGRLGSGGVAFNGLAITLAFLRRFDEARRLNEEGLRISRSLGYRALQAHILENFAEIELASGFLDHAESGCRQSLAIHQELGNRFREGRILFILGIISLERGEFDATGEHLARADDHFAACGAVASRSELLLVLAALEAKLGRPHEAQQILDEVEASTIVDAPPMDPPVVEATRALIQMALARSIRDKDPDGAGACIQAARAHLVNNDPSKLRLPSFLPVFSRLLERELDAWDAGSPTPTRSEERSLLLVGSKRDWFQFVGAGRVDLRGRVVLRRIFAALVQARIASPGAAIDPNELVDMVWPGVGMIPGRATKRLYMAVLLLRDLGLRTTLLTVESGYLLDPQTPLHVEDQAQSANESAPQMGHHFGSKPSLPGRTHDGRSAGS